MQGIRKGRMPITQGLGCPQKYYFFIPQENIECWAARATTKVALVSYVTYYLSLFTYKRPAPCGVRPSYAELLVPLE